MAIIRSNMDRITNKMNNIRGNLKRLIFYINNKKKKIMCCGLIPRVTLGVRAQVVAKNLI